MMKIIAEIGWNFMGDMGLADDMISAAAESGASVVKFQYWDPKYLKPGVWDTDGRREIYNKACLDEEKIEYLINCAGKYNCDFLISVFGTKGAKLIHSMNQDQIKIPSHEVANIKLLEYCADHFKEVLFSAGACTEKEVKRAIDILDNGSSEYILMHCVSAYPCEEDRINLQRIKWLKGYNQRVGLSDHTQSTIVPALALSYEIEAIEKHFTIDNDLPGRDNKFALNPIQFKEMVQNMNIAQRTMIDHGNNYQDIESDTVENYRGRWESHDYE